jgi:hypothetical protein
VSHLVSVNWLNPTVEFKGYSLTAEIKKLERLGA